MSNKKYHKGDNGNVIVEVNYNDDAIKEKKVKFTAKEGDSFEITVDDLVDICANYVNSDKLEPMYVESEYLDIVQVTRQVKAKAERDIKKGDEIRLEYIHPYPLEFAVIEKMHNLAKLDEGVETYRLTQDKIDEMNKKIKPQMKEYIEKFYKSFQSVYLDKNKKDVNK